MDNLEAAIPERQPGQEEESQRIVEAVRSCLQTSLVGEAQNFRSWVAAAHRKFKDLQNLALGLTAITCLLSSCMLVASVWQARRITRQAEAQLQYFQKQAAASPDAFTDLRRGNWAPAGKPITQKGRTFIELKAAK
ncbi:MAG: hypothetical protein ABSH48_12830 [Verrucomicrobiota bacterium]